MPPAPPWEMLSRPSQDIQNPLDKAPVCFPAQLWRDTLAWDECLEKCSVMGYPQNWPQSRHCKDCFTEEHNQFCIPPVYGCWLPPRASNQPVVSSTQRKAFCFLSSLLGSSFFSLCASVSPAGSRTEPCSFGFLGLQRSFPCSSQ